MVRTTHGQTTTFTPNQKLPVHRWFRYSAGFSGRWVEEILRSELTSGVVLDPFAGVATTLIAARNVGLDSIGVEAHPFIQRVAIAKLAAWEVDPDTFRRAALDVASQRDRTIAPSSNKLLSQIYKPETLSALQTLHRSVEGTQGPEPLRRLLWLCLMAILRSCSGVGTAPWQYVLPNKAKARVASPHEAFKAQAEMMCQDMQDLQPGARASLLCGDARHLCGVEDCSIDRVITSPPYPNNYDYADATRIELTFLGEVERWRDLHEHTRRHLMVSCSQHARNDKLQLSELLADNGVEVIRDDLSIACHELAALRGTRKGKKHYDTMIAAYFRDMSQVLCEIARVLRVGARACLVIGDSAPYGVHLPVERWIAEIGAASGLEFVEFEQTRQRNIKWKNRKHRVPLKEGRLWLRRG